MKTQIQPPKDKDGRDNYPPTSPEWVGGPLSESKSLQFYRSVMIHGKIYSVENFVMLPASSDLRPKSCFVAQIVMLWTDRRTGQKWMRNRWLYRPKECGLPADAFSNELFMSDWYDDNSVECIMERCHVLPLKMYSSFGDRASQTTNIFFCRYFYNPSGGEFYKALEVSKWDISQSLAIIERQLDIRIPVRSTITSIPHHVDPTAVGETKESGVCVWNPNTLTESEVDAFTERALAKYDRDWSKKTWPSKGLCIERVLLVLFEEGGDTEKALQRLSKPEQRRCTHGPVEQRIAKDLKDEQQLEEWDCDDDQRKAPRIVPSGNRPRRQQMNGNGWKAPVVTRTNRCPEALVSVTPGDLLVPRNAAGGGGGGGGGMPELEGSAGGGAAGARGNNSLSTTTTTTKKSHHYGGNSNSNNNNNNSHHSRESVPGGKSRSIVFVVGGKRKEMNGHSHRDNIDNSGVRTAGTSDAHGKSNGGGKRARSSSSSSSGNSSGRNSPASGGDDARRQNGGVDSGEAEITTTSSTSQANNNVGSNHTQNNNNKNGGNGKSNSHKKRQHTEQHRREEVGTKVQSVKVRGEDYTVGDCVKVRGPTRKKRSLEFLAEIRSLTVLPTGEGRALFRWLYRLTDVPKNLRPDPCVPNEVLYSYHEDVDTVDSVISLCTVYGRPDYGPAVEEIPAPHNNVYFCRTVFDPVKLAVHPINPDAKI